MKVLKIDEMAAYTRINTTSENDNVLTFLYHHNETIKDVAKKYNKAAFEFLFNKKMLRRYVLEIDHYRGGSSMDCYIKAMSGIVEDNGKHAMFARNSIEDFGKVKITFEGGDEKKPIAFVMAEILTDLDGEFFEAAKEQNLELNGVRYINNYNDKDETFTDKKITTDSQYTLTSGDIRTLMKNGADERDVDMIQSCLDANGMVFTDASGKEINAEQAIKILGSADFLSGLESATFNYKCSRGIGTNKVVFNCKDWHDNK